MHTTLLDGGLEVSIGHRAYVAQDALGDGEPFAASVARTAVMKEIKQAQYSVDGMEIQNQSRLVFLGNVTVGSHDEITLPDGTTPPILEIGGVRDPTGGRFYTVVTLGQHVRPRQSGGF